MRFTTSRLTSEVLDLPGHETRRLLLLAAGKDSAWMIGDPEVPLGVADRFRELVERRRSGEPLQYIEGTVEFGPLQLLADRRALIPRPETERLWELIVETADPDPGVIVDLCTGSGNLALALAHAFPNAEVYGVDISPAAISLATENAKRTGLRASFLVGDLFDVLPEAIRGEVDLLVSNPPYVSTSGMDDLPAEVRDYEPAMALEAGPTGMAILKRIAGEAGRWLRPGGLLGCEIGETQGEASLRVFSAFGPRIECDLAGRTRYVVGRAPECANVH